MSRPKLYKPPVRLRVIDEPRCACGCGEDGAFGFAGNVFYAQGHWPAELRPGGRPAAEAPPVPPVPPRRSEAGAPAQGELFGLTNPVRRPMNRPSGLTNPPSGLPHRPSGLTGRTPS